ncbi:unnamed protein product, partial [Mesorhabditis spiculigera]
MVRVLRNGADDGGRQPASNLRLPQQQAQANPLTSVWNAGNQRLNEFGLQNFSVGGFEFQPMHLVAAVIAFFLIGPMGALLVIGMTVFQQYSSRESPQNPVATNLFQGREAGPSAPRLSEPKPKKTNVFGGAGQRLGN